MFPESSHHLIISEEAVVQAAGLGTKWPGYADGCYQKMLVTHPPCRQIEMRGAEDISDYIPHVTAVESSEGGVRFGTILSNVKGALSSLPWHPISTLSVSPARVEFSCAVRWRFLPENVLYKLTGWEMLALLNESDPKDMTAEIEHVVDAFKKWDHVADGQSDAEDKQKEAFAWELDNVEQESPFETVTVGSGPW